jgi:hypothetical protein
MLQRVTIEVLSDDVLLFLSSPIEDVYLLTDFFKKYSYSNSDSEDKRSRALDELSAALARECRDCVHESNIYDLSRTLIFAVMHELFPALILSKFATSQLGGHFIFSAIAKTPLVHR